MKTKTGLLAVGLFTIAGALTVSCGGSSDSTDNPSTAGSSNNSSAGKGTGGTSSAGNSSSAGTTNNSAGTAANNGGTNSNGGNASNGGRNNNTGGFDIGAGGAGLEVPDCPATAKNGAACTPMGGNNACQIDADNYCTCRAQGQGDAKWTCVDLGALGGGGAGGGAVTCPAAPKNGDTCTGLGLCPGSQTCGCGLGTVYCQP